MYIHFLSSLLLLVKQRFEPGENSLDANGLFMSEKNI